MMRERTYGAQELITGFYEYMSVLYKGIPRQGRNPRIEFKKSKGQGNYVEFDFAGEEYSAKFFEKDKKIYFQLSITRDSPDNNVLNGLRNILEQKDNEVVGRARVWIDNDAGIERLNVSRKIRMILKGKRGHLSDDLFKILKNCIIIPVYDCMK